MAQFSFIYESEGEIQVACFLGIIRAEA